MQTRTHQKTHMDIVDIAAGTGSSPTAAIVAHPASALATCDGCG